VKLSKKSLFAIYPYVVELQITCSRIACALNGIGPLVLSNVTKRYSDRCHTCDSNANCVNTIGFYECPCLTGFTGDGSGPCSDIDECNDAENADRCDQHASCENSIGSFSCACDDGFTGDGLKCENINECENDSHECADNADCTDSIGNYFCECWPGFKGDGNKCDDVNECTEKERDPVTGELTELNFCTKFPLRPDLSPSICSNTPG